MSQIKSINIGFKTNYVSFDDEDASTDLFHGVSLNQRDTIEYVKKYGGEYIQIHTDYNEGKEQSKYLNKVAKIAKQTGYENKVTVSNQYQEMDGIRQEWTEISGQLVKGVVV